MHVKNHIAAFSDALIYRRSKTDVRNENTVHYINVKILCAGFFDYFKLFIKSSKIGR